jgi:hypothetical protein
LKKKSDWRQRQRLKPKQLLLPPPKRKKMMASETTGTSRELVK